MRLKMKTAGESHGKMISTLIEGLPSGFFVDEEYINNMLKKRQHGYGRGKRMSIENDKVDIISGLTRDNITTGAPVNLLIENFDHKNWKDKPMPVLRAGRPGHGDLYGSVKYDINNMRYVLERASARETASRVAAGAIFKNMLELFGVKIYSFTTSIGNLEFPERFTLSDEEKIFLRESDTASPCIQEQEICRKEVDKAIADKDSLGGSVRLLIEKVPMGIGSYSQYDTRLDSRLSMVLMSIQSVKGVLIGDPKYYQKRGSLSHDEIYYDNGIRHKTNNSGGINAGVSTGETINCKLLVKPVPTLMSPLETIDLDTMEDVDAIKERSDVWICPALSVVAESMAAYCILNEFLEKFGGDNISDTISSFNRYIDRASL
ncbi:MAG: chorismate synthase [Candidatus Muiribacterium halophilum]|uniref:Chorismate synthase n=1 Tax=Muiribacterium halophilum TaxID=2053465 RepID=A0A2N5ZJN2_MUIH1|nr:MAG: chorismate synthase [Candidatus Muirbacterium halophilum]